MAEALNRGPPADRQLEAVLREPSGRMTATMVSLAALVLVGAALANVLPNLDYSSFPTFERITLPKFDRLAMPKIDQIPLPDFNRKPAPVPVPAPAPSRVAAQPLQKSAQLALPDPVVNAALRDIQSTQQQNTATLASLTQGAAAQNIELKRISRQLTALASQVDALHGSVAPMTTSSIPPQNPRSRQARVSRRELPYRTDPVSRADPPNLSLPKAVGPVSVGGAPLAFPSGGV